MNLIRKLIVICCIVLVNSCQNDRHFKDVFDIPVDVSLNELRSNHYVVYFSQDDSSWVAEKKFGTIFSRIIFSSTTENSYRHQLSIDLTEFSAYCDTVTKCGKVKIQGNWYHVIWPMSVEDVKKTKYRNSKFYTRRRNVILRRRVFKGEKEDLSDSSNVIFYRG